MWHTLIFFVNFKRLSFSSGIQCWPDFDKFDAQFIFVTFQGLHIESLFVLKKQYVMKLFRSRFFKCALRGLMSDYLLNAWTDSNKILMVCTVHYPRS